MITVKHSSELEQWLSTYEVEGQTIANVLFAGGRLSYPGRKEIEIQLGETEPYTLTHEARVIYGLPKNVENAIKLLADLAFEYADDPTLEMLWDAHSAYRKEISLDRLVAALVGVNIVSSNSETGVSLASSCLTLVSFLNSAGFPPSSIALEEICDGAMPACVGLNLVDVDWKTD